MRAFSTCLIALALSLAFHIANAAATKPNIILVLADDLGWSDLGCQGSKYYLTPNLDRMAMEGLRFTDGHSSGPNCQPTRAALMSGQYMPRTGVYTVGGIDRFDWKSRPLRPVDNVSQLPLEKITIAQAMKTGGYATAMFGKWHLGDDGEHHPSKRGFDHAIVSAGKHFNFETNPKQDVPPGTYLADYLTDKAVEFIRSSREKPFFLFLPHYGVHSPHDAKPELIEKFRDRKPVGNQKSPEYAAMIYSLDESVGRIMAVLDELRISKNTLLIFSSDNGGVGGHRAEGLNSEGITDNSPLRGGKGMLYEGGIRVPFIFRWPGTIAPGTTCDQIIASIDYYPTFLELGGAQPPEGYVLDGKSFAKLLLSGGKGTLDREAVFWHFPGYLGAGAGLWRTTPAGAIRQGDWKLIEFFEDSRRELYNLRQDLGERNNLAQSQPEKAKELADRLAAWRKEMKAPMPTPNKDQTSVSTPAPAKKKKKRANR